MASSLSTFNPAVHPQALLYVETEAVLKPLHINVYNASPAHSFTKPTILKNLWNQHPPSSNVGKLLWDQPSFTMTSPIIKPPTLTGYYKLKPLFYACNPRLAQFLSGLDPYQCFQDYEGVNRGHARTPYDRPRLQVSRHKRSAESGFDQQENADAVFRTGDLEGLSPTYFCESDVVCINNGLPPPSDGRRNGKTRGLCFPSFIGVRSLRF